MKEEVEKALDLIRPALQNDGGDVELVDVDEANRHRQGQAHRRLR